MKLFRNFIVKNSQRVFYFTGGALLFAIGLFVLMQFVSWDEDFLASQIPDDSPEKLEQIVERARGQGLGEKLDSGAVPLLLSATAIKEEVVLDRSTKKDLEVMIQDFLSVFERLPNKDYKENLAPFVLPESLGPVSRRQDSFDNPLLDCQKRCIYASSFPPQEIPIKIIASDKEHIQAAFSAFVFYQSLDGKRGELSGLQPRFYSLILVPGGKGWLVARVLARYR